MWFKKYFDVIIRPLGEKFRGILEGDFGRLFLIDGNFLSFGDRFWHVALEIYNIFIKLKYIQLYDHPFKKTAHFHSFWLSEF